MSTPHQVATRWQQLGSTSEVDEHGQATFSMHFVEMVSGEEFTCSVTGRGEADGGYFIAALQAMAAAINHQMGMPDLPGAKFCPKTNLN